MQVLAGCNSTGARSLPDGAKGERAWQVLAGLLRFRRRHESKRGAEGERIVQVLAVELRLRSSCYGYGAEGERKKQVLAGSTRAPTCDSRRVECKW